MTFFDLTRRRKIFVFHRILTAFFSFASACFSFFYERSEKTITTNPPSFVIENLAFSIAFLIIVIF